MACSANPIFVVNQPSGHFQWKAGVEVWELNMFCVFWVQSIVHKHYSMMFPFSLFGRLVHSGRSQGSWENKLRYLLASSSHHLRSQMWVVVKDFRHVVVLGVWDLISGFHEFTPWQKQITFDEHMKPFWPFWPKKHLVQNQNPEKRLRKTLL